MAAAVADFRPADAHRRQDHEGRAAQELSSSSSRPRTSLAGARRRAAPGQTVVGFAAEHGEGAVERGRAKLARKGLDAVVVNDISRSDVGFDSAENEVTIVAAGRRAPRRPATQGRGRGRDPGRGRTAEDAPPNGEYLRNGYMSEQSAYELFKKGSELLDSGDFMAASVPLERRARWSPTRARSARRSAGRTSARGASTRRRRSSLRWSSATP